MGKVISLKKYKTQHSETSKEEELDKLLDKYQEKIDKNSKNDSKIHK